MAGGAIAWLFFTRMSPPAIPQVALAPLDPDSASLINQHLQAVRDAPRSGLAWGRLGAILRSYEFRLEARHCLAEAERLDPANPRWPYLQASLLRQQAPEEALAKLRRTVALCENQPSAPRLHLARWLGETGQWPEAERELRELLRAEPNQPMALLTLAYAAQANGELTNAVTLAGRCTTDATTARAAWTLLGALHRRLGDTNAAFLASRRAKALAPDVSPPDPFDDEFRRLRADARSLSDRAQQRLMARSLEEAASLVEQLVQRHPQFSETWLLLGRLKFLQNQPAAAEQALLRHLQMDPDSINGQFQLGMALLSQSRWLEAAAAFQKATLRKADFGPAFFNLGFARVKAGQKLEAVSPFREAIRHNPEHLDSYVLLADLSLQLGRKGDAIELERQARTLDPNDSRLPVLRDKIARQ
jgi:tetratricopeptide (TPR) repeat protein